MVNIKLKYVQKSKLIKQKNLKNANRIKEINFRLNI